MCEVACGFVITIIPNLSDLSSSLNSPTSRHNLCKVSPTICPYIHKIITFPIVNFL